MIPDFASFADWTNAKMSMDILIGTESRGKPVQLWPDGRKGNKKTWRSPKKI